MFVQPLAGPSTFASRPSGVSRSRTPTCTALLPIAARPTPAAQRPPSLSPPARTTPPPPEPRKVRPTPSLHRLGRRPSIQTAAHLAPSNASIPSRVFPRPRGVPRDARAARASFSGRTALSLGRTPSDRRAYPRPAGPPAGARQFSTSRARHPAHALLTVQCIVVPRPACFSHRFPTPSTTRSLPSPAPAAPTGPLDAFFLLADAGEDVVHRRRRIGAHPTFPATWRLERERPPRGG